MISVLFVWCMVARSTAMVACAKTATFEKAKRENIDFLVWNNRVEVKKRIGGKDLEHFVKSPPPSLFSSHLSCHYDRLAGKRQSKTFLHWTGWNESCLKRKRGTSREWRAGAPEVSDKRGSGRRRNPKTCFSLLKQSDLTHSLLRPTKEHVSLVIKSFQSSEQ